MAVQQVLNNRIKHTVQYYCTSRECNGKHSTARLGNGTFGSILHDHNQSIKPFEFNEE